MKLIDHLIKRSPYERTFHAVSYEVVGVITSAPLIAFFSGKNMAESGFIAIMVSVIATLWNYLFNLLFDIVTRKRSIKKTARVRVFHSILFEVGLIALTVPAISFTMGLSFYQAFMLELAMLIYFLPYTFVFNWCYDALKGKLIGYLLRKENQTL